MKIALVTETYPPEINGVAMTLSRLVAGMSARGHAVDVVRPRQRSELRAGVKIDSDLSVVAPAPLQSGAATSAGSVAAVQPGPVTQVLVRGVPIPFYPALRMGLPVLGGLRRRWSAERPDIVHVATEGPLGWAALRVARKLGLPVTSTFHTNFHHYGGHYGLKLLRGPITSYLRWFHNLTRITLVPATDMRDELAALGFERLGILARGVDTRLFDPARRSDELRAKWGASSGTPVVIYVGRLAAEKNIDLAVEAFEVLRGHLPDARFVLVGDGPERPRLEAAHGEFHFAGVQRGEALAAHYASADVFFFPSVTETFGNVITEGMASGLVVQAYDYAAGREHLRDGVNGCKVRFGDSAAFLKRADAVAASRDSWSAWRAAARQTALGLTWDGIFDRFEADLRAAAGISMESGGSEGPAPTGTSR